jgi:hypothetical protein
MKTKAMLIAVLVLSAAGGGDCSFGQQPSPSPPPRAVVVVIDTSWSSARYMSDFRSLARQAAAALGPGDYLEILAARAGSPSLKLATAIKSGSAEEIKSIDAVLSSIRAQFLSTASIANALDVASARMNEVSSKRDIANVTAIVFTRCEVSREEATRILALADKFNGRKWSLHLTGTRSTNRDLLVGANKGRLRLSLISETNPALWLAKNEPEGPPPKEEVVPPPEPKPPAQPPAPSPMETRPTPDTSQGRVEDLGQTQTQGQGYHLSLDSVIKVGPLPQPPGATSAATPPETGKEPKQPSKPPDERPAETKKGRPPLGQSSWGWLSHHPRQILLGAALLLLVCLAVVAIVLLRGGFKEARQWTTRMNARLRPRKVQNDGILTLRLNDQPHRLGRLDQIKEIHVGSGEQNTIRIPDKSLADRLLSLYGKANGLMLRNISGAPLNVNGRIVKPRRSTAVVLGSPIKLNERFTLTPELVRPQPSPNTTHNRSNQDGPTQQ